MAEKTVISGVISDALAVGDVGHGGAPGIRVINVPAGKKFYMTGAYGVAGVSGMATIFDSDGGDETNLAAVNAAAKLKLYISDSGDGITDIKVGPFSNDVYVSSDGTLVIAAAGDMAIWGYLE